MKGKLANDIETGMNCDFGVYKTTMQKPEILEWNLGQVIPDLYTYCWEQDWELFWLPHYSGFS